MAAASQQLNIENLDEMLGKLEGVLTAAENDMYADGDISEARRASGSRTAKVAYIKQAMADLDEDGRRELKTAMGLMETGGDKKSGAKDARGALDDERLDDDLDEGFPPKEAEDRFSRDGDGIPSEKSLANVGALQAAIRREIGPLVKRVQALQAAHTRARTRPLVDKILVARAAHGMPGDKLVAFERKLLNASYKDVRERYEEDLPLLGQQAALSMADGGDYGATLLASAGQIGYVDPHQGVPYNGLGGGGGGSDGGVLSAAVHDVIDEWQTMPGAGGGGGAPDAILPMGALGAAQQMPMPAGGAGGGIPVGAPGGPLPGGARVLAGTGTGAI